MEIHRKFLSVTAIAALGSFAGATVSSAAEIQWWHAFTGRLGELLNEQVATFNASGSQCQVSAVHKGNYSETLNAGIAAFRAGEQPTILQVFEVGTATMMAAKGAVKPAFEVMKEADKAFDAQNYLAAVTGYYTTTDGEMLSFPYNSSTPVFYYSKDAFAKAGLDPEKAPKTWPEVGEAAKALKAAGHTCPLTTSWQSWVHLENLSAYHNTPFASKGNGFEGTDTELSFNSPLQVQHIEAMGNWAKDGLFSYSGRRNEGTARFRAGECAMLTESSAGYASIKKEAQFEFAVTNLPYWSEVEGAPQNTIIGGASLWVMEGKSAEEYQCVAEFFEFMSQPEIQSKWHQDTGYMPITPAAYELTKEQGFYQKNPGTDVAIIQMTGKAPTADSKGLRLGGFDQIRGFIDEELEGVWSGDKTAQQALDSAVERGNKVLRRFERQSN